jgi:hypothetical protein
LLVHGSSPLSFAFVSLFTVIGCSVGQNTFCK